MLKIILLFVLFIVFVLCIIYLLLANSNEKYKAELYNNSILSMSFNEKCHLQKRLKFYLGNLFHEKKKFHHS